MPCFEIACPYTATTTENLITCQSRRNAESISAFLESPYALPGICETYSMASPQHECVESSAVLQWSDLRLMRALVERLRSVGRLCQEEIMENYHVTAPVHSAGSDAVP